MLKSTFAPIFTAFPAKPRPLRKLSRYTTIISSGRTQTPPPTVQQNASTTTTTAAIPPQQQFSAPTSAYIHLPFCRKRCHYCDFPIVALGSASPADDDPRVVNYVQSLQREITSTESGFSAHPPLETVFFGGGTPSLVSPTVVLSILDTLRAKFGISPDAEVSMEMDPGTFDGKKMKELMGFGVNRVSLGVQAFQEELLKSCGRAHGIREVYEAIEILGSCGVANWSMDLISSLPHQTTQMWEESLRLTINAAPKHVSVYDLQVEEGTKFGVLYSPGDFPLPSERDSAKFYRMASRMLSEAGYEHYEISSYSKNGFECKHNSVYWVSKPFYGFGLGSASYVNGVRFSRPRKMKEYAGYVQDLEDGKVDSDRDDGGGVDAKDMAMDVVMLSLRTSRGLDLRSFAKAFGGSLACSICNVYKPYVESEHVIYLDEERRAITADEFNSLVFEEDDIPKGLAHLRLSDPSGFLLSNELISLAFAAISP